MEQTDKLEAVESSQVWWCGGDHDHESMTIVCVEAVGQGGRQGPVEEAYGLPEGDCACRSSPSPEGR